MVRSFLLEYLGRIDIADIALVIQYMLYIEWKLPVPFWGHITEEVHEYRLVQCSCICAMYPSFGKLYWYITGTIKQ